MHRLKRIIYDKRAVISGRNQSGDSVHINLVRYMRFEFKKDDATIHQVTVFKYDE